MGNGMPDLPPIGRRCILSKLFLGTSVVLLGSSQFNLASLGSDSWVKADGNLVENTNLPDSSFSPAHLATRFEFEASAAEAKSLPVLSAQFFEGRDWPDRLRVLVENDFSHGLVRVVGSWLVAEHEVAFGFAVRDGLEVDVV